MECLVDTYDLPAMLRTMTDSGQEIPVAPASPLDRVARGISIVADYGFGVAVAESIAVLRKKRSPLAAARRLAVVGISVAVVNYALKQLVSRPRPEGAATPHGFVRLPSSPSFPSGHTLAATTAAVALSDTLTGATFGVAGAGLVGWSRLRLRAHHGSDVIGGVVIGAILGLACRIVLSRLDRE